jgi:diguanylate cyclase (GGDEF)-like protein/PAS domain S-box-containing protein
MPASPINTLSQTDLQRLLDAVPVPLFIKNASGEVLFLNQTWRHTLGLGDDALAPRDDAALFTPAQMARFAEQDRLAFAQGSALTKEEDLVWNAEAVHNRRMLTTLAPVFDTAGAPQFLVGTTRDITEQRYLERQAQSERALLEMLVSQVPLADIMHSFLSDFESTFPGVHCSVLLLDDDGMHLHHCAAPSLPPAYCQALDGSAIGMGVGSCGTAAFTGQDVLVADIASDATWAQFRALALGHGLKACWSVPIRSSQGRTLGTFGNYYRHVRSPSEAELQAIQRSAYLLGLAIERDRNAQHMEAHRHALEDAGRYRQAILDSMVDGLLTIDRYGHLLSHNNAAASMLGLDAQGAPQQLSPLFTTPLDTLADGSLAWLEHLDAREGQGKTVEARVQRHGGPGFPVSVSLSTIPHTSTPRYVVLLRDITQQRQDEEEIRRLAFYDPLTGLPNRRLLLDRVRHAMANAARLQQHGSLMFLDLDHFKLLNDTLGHDVGDELLQQVATRLRSCVRDGDSVARLGGDEFVVLLEGLSPQAGEAATQAEVVAHKILDTLAQPYSLRQHHYSSTPSIGIVVFMQDHESMDDLLKKADVAMYQAKAAGRNTARFFDPVMQAAVATHAELAKEIRLGLQREEFVLHYQIQVDQQGRCLGAEALVRWNHPTRGLVTPGHFIPLAEETGMILPLGQWVLETACTQLLAWSRQPATAHWTLAVNVSASQLAQAGFVCSVGKALRQSGAPATQLKLEITESMLVNDMEDIIEKMGAVQALGVSFSLDDFGTGYSSLSYLKRLPLSQLKIDQSFVRDVLSDPSDAVIARTVVALGHSLGLQVIAEGVESAAQRDALAEMGCDAFQGYFLGRPAPAHALGVHGLADPLDLVPGR